MTAADTRRKRDRLAKQIRAGYTPEHSLEDAKREVARLDKLLEPAEKPKDK